MKLNIKKGTLISFFLIFLIFLSVFYTSKSEKQVYKIAYIASYHPEFAWVIDIEEGIRNAFARKGIAIELHSFFMDTKRQSSPEQVQERARLAREFIKKVDPAITIVSDDNAIHYVALKMKSEKYKFVFCGANDEPESYGLPSDYITGVLERHRFSDAVKVMKMLVPNIKKIAVLSEKSESSDLIVGQLLEKKDRIKAEIVNVYQTNSYSQWQEFIKENSNKVDAFMVILYFSLKDNNGAPVAGDTVIRWLTQNSKIPELGIFEFFVQDGGLVSDAVNGHSQGYFAGKMALDILKGKDPKSIRVKKTKDGIIYINALRAKDLGFLIPPNLYQSSNIIWSK